MDNPDIFFGSTNFDNVHQEEQISSSCTVEDVDNINNTIFAGSMNSIVSNSSDNSVPLGVLPSQNESGVLPSSADPNSADYNVQNYANYNNYMYNYNNYYGYPYPQYQWDYNNQQYYQPYQNYYSLNFNSKQSQASKKPLPSPQNDIVQLPVEEKPKNKLNNATVDDSNRYSPSAEIDDDDDTTIEEIKNDSSIAPSEETHYVTNSVDGTNSSELQEKHLNSNDHGNKQQSISLTPQIQQSLSLTTQIQQPIFMPNSQNHIQLSANTAMAPGHQQQLSGIINKDENQEKINKGPVVLGKSQAKKRLMAFSMMKQKLQEQNAAINDNQNSDITEANDSEFVPDLNIFQTTTKKKTVIKKAVKVIKAEQTIEQIEEMKKTELMQGNNTALYQQLLLSGGNEAPILQKLGIESLSGKYSASIRNQGKRSKRHQYGRHRDENRRSHRYRRHSPSKSRSRSNERPKIKALEVRSWKDFVSSGYHFEKFRKYKLNELEELKDKERKGKSKRRYSDIQSDDHSRNQEFMSELDRKSTDNQRCNIFEQKKEILKSVEVKCIDEKLKKDFPSYSIRYTKTEPVLKYSFNPARVTRQLMNRQQMLDSLVPEIEVIVHKFLSSIKPKKMKDNCTDLYYNEVNDKIITLMKNKNVYPFKGWWPKLPFIITQVKENPNIEIDKDEEINKLTSSKRAKKSRFNNESYIVDLRPTVPSKWDSDYDGSPIIEKSMEPEVSQLCSQPLNTNNVYDNKNIEPKYLCNKEDMDIASDVGVEEFTIEANTKSISSSKHLIQEINSLDNEYEEFLKTVTIENDKNQQINQDVKPVVLPITHCIQLDDSIQNESEDNLIKVSDDNITLTKVNVITESQIDKNSHLIDFKDDSKSRKSTHKKLKKKDNKKKKHESSSSDSSSKSVSDSDSSTSDSESDSSDSSSSMEIKRKVKKSKEKKKKKSKSNKSKVKDFALKNKIMEDDNSGILNLIEKAFNVEIKMKSSDVEELKMKKKKKKYNKKGENHNEDLLKVKECLKETITKLVKPTDTVTKNASSKNSENDTVNEVLKLLKMNEAVGNKKKKSKKSKRKHDTDESEEDISLKKTKVDDIFHVEEVEKMKKKKKKKSAEKFPKKKSKKREKTTDVSDSSEELEELNKKKSISSKNEPEHFFGQRPNEWNIKQHSMRGVVHQSDHNKEITKNKVLYCNDINNFKKPLEYQLNCKSIDKLDLSNFTTDEELKINLSGSENYINTEEILINKKDKKTSSKNLPKTQEKSSINNSILEMIPEDRNLNSNKIQILSSIIGNELSVKDDSELKITTIKPPPAKDNLSHRDKVKLNLLKLSNVQDMSFMGFGFPTNFNFTQSKKSENKKGVETEVIDTEIKFVKSLLPLSNKSDFDTYPKKSEQDLITAKIDKDISYSFQSSSSESIKVSAERNKDNTKIKNKCNEVHLLTTESTIIDVTYPLMTKQKYKSIITTDNIRNIDESNMPCIDLPKVNIVKNKEGLDSMDNKLIYNEEKTFSQLRDNIVYPVMFNCTLKSNTVINQQEVNLALKKLDSVNLSNSLFDSSSKLVIKHHEDPSTMSDISELELESNVKEQIKSPEHKKIKSNDSSIQIPIDNKKIEERTFSNKSDNLIVKKHHNDKEKNSLHSINLNNIIIDPQNSSDLIITSRVKEWNNLGTSILDGNDSSEIKYDSFKSNKYKKESHYSSRLQSLNENKLTYSKSKYSKNSTLISKSDNKFEIATNEGENLQNSSQIHTDKNINYSTNEVISSIDCINEDSRYNYSESWTKKPENYSEMYSNIPEYSELKTIEACTLNPINYTIYQDYNPDCSSYHEKEFDIWKPEDIPQYSNKYADTSIQVGNVLEILPSNYTSNDDIAMHQDTAESNKIFANEPPGKICESEITIKSSDDQFSKLYLQHVKQYSHKPIQFSTTKQAFNNLIEILPEAELPHRSKIDQDLQTPIPLRPRAYSAIAEDNSNVLYITSDNYIAYCAIEDKCMVHIAVDTSKHKSVEVSVRHCFNINENGTIDEYWLHADLIPFHTSSDCESGVYSDDDDKSLDSETGQSDIVENDLDGVEWEIVDGDSDSSEDWLNNPGLLDQYGEIVEVEQNVNKFDSTSSSEYDSDSSDSSEKCYMYNKSIIHEFNENNTENNAKFSATEVSKFVQNQSCSNTSQSKSNPLSNNVSGEENGQILIQDLEKMNTILNQNLIIQKIRMQSKSRVNKKQPDTLLVSYSDNMETMKHPFLGLFQPPTTSILRNELKENSLSKRVSFADGINPGEDLVESLTNDEYYRSMSPPPLKALLRESLKIKRQHFPFRRSKKIRAKMTMLNSKSAVLPPLIQTNSLSSVNYYISSRPSEEKCALEKMDFAGLISPSSDSDLNSDNKATPPRLTRELTPIPSDDDDCAWNNESSIKESQ
ncbi:uncharacterized protein PF3D7_1120600-like isoform X2 [Daktulosphaira vitifoliae]|uniref:uncharacterized protein PF3D7_1120600-like isoform X2 n=1 Tax=Daktulosphaira vitifoliae TaxID=58002 RepID=UPI0021AA5324|nr:uncharacterized protein PF3D7_1120600-like isoform X2 [Daktulosphaira vitifoliae]